MTTARRKPRPKKSVARGEARIVQEGDVLVAYAHVHARTVRNPKKAVTHSERHSRSGKASTVAKWEAIDERIKPVAERLKVKGLPLRKWTAAIEDETGFDVRTIRTHLHALGYRPPTKKRT